MSTIDAVRERQALLRDRYGRQRWIELVTETAGAAYRLAGMRPKEFRDAVVAGDGSPGRLRIQINRRITKRFRPFFAAVNGGGLVYLDGVIGAVINESGFTFRDAGFIPGDPGECYVDLRPEQPFHPSVFGSALAGNGIRSLLGDRHVPPIVRECDPEIVDVSQGEEGEGPWRWSFTRVVFRSRYESIVRMPNRVADELGIERQTELADVPWLRDLGVTGRRDASERANVAPMRGGNFAPAKSSPIVWFPEPRPPLIQGVRSCRIVGDL